MLEIERSSETLRVRSDNLELAFRYGNDRWLHELSVHEGNHWQHLLRSVEGTADEPVPPSPALQDLRLEQLSDQIFEFQGMGQAGGAIYSAAVRFDVPSREIVFDLCVRGKRSDSSIRAQSFYEPAPGSKIAVEHDQLEILTSSDVGLSFGAIRINDQPAAECRVIEPPGTRQIAAGYFSVEPCATGSRPRSLRWSYRFTLDGLP